MITAFLCVYIPRISHLLESLLKSYPFSACFINGITHGASNHCHSSTISTFRPKIGDIVNNLAPLSEVGLNYGVGFCLFLLG